MVAVFILLILLVVILGPSIWVKYVLRKHHRQLDGMPGTGGELAVHLLSRYELENVKVEESVKNDDHYSPGDNAVRLSPEVYEGKTLTAIAVAAHEVGHAIQFNRQEAVTRLRKRYFPVALAIQRYGVFILMCVPIVAGLIRSPAVMLAIGVVGIVTMLVSVLMYAAILPEEWDASFNKALPILEKGEYVPKEYMPAIRQVLKACALTYVAAALADVLRLWRWLRFLR